MKVEEWMLLFCELGIVFAVLASIDLLAAEIATPIVGLTRRVMQKRGDLVFGHPRFVVGWVTISAVLDWAAIFCALLIAFRVVLPGVVRGVAAQMFLAQIAFQISIALFFVRAVTVVLCRVAEWAWPSE